MNEEKTTTWQWRQGYDYATAKYKAEIDRLRAANDELVRQWEKQVSKMQSEINELRNQLMNDRPSAAKTAKEGE